MSFIDSARENRPAPMRADPSPRASRSIRRVFTRSDQQNRPQSADYGQGACNIRGHNPAHWFSLSPIVPLYQRYPDKRRQT